MTLEHSTDIDLEAETYCSQPGHHAKDSASLENAQGCLIPVADLYQSFSESLTNPNQLSYLLRIHLTHSILLATTLSVDWRESAMKSSTLSVMKPACSGLSSKVKELSVFPRPTTGAPLCGGTGSFKKMQRLKEQGAITEEERKNLVSGSGGKSNPALMEWLMGFPIGWTE